MAEQSYVVTKTYILGFDELRYVNKYLLDNRQIFNNKLTIRFYNLILTFEML